MLLAKLDLREEGGRKYLAGTTRYELPRKSLVIVKKVDGEWRLYELAPRRINTDPRTIDSFDLPLEES